MEHTFRQDWFRYPMIAHLLDSLRAYGESGRPTGDFLRCVLENDLFGAVARADWQNERLIPRLCEYIQNEMPSASYGSPEKVDKWIITHRAAL